MDRNIAVALAVLAVLGPGRALADATDELSLEEAPAPEDNGALARAVVFASLAAPLRATQAVLPLAPEAAESPVFDWVSPIFVWVEPGYAYAETYVLFE